MTKYRMLDLFCGRGGWTNAFLERGWECVGVDNKPQPNYRGELLLADILLQLRIDVDGYFYLICPERRSTVHRLGYFDFICGSSPCENFTCVQLRNFFPEPKYPALGVSLFNHTRQLCWESRRPWVMENVRAAQEFVGPAVTHCGPFYLWGNAVPPLMPQGILKNWETFNNGRSGGPGRMTKGARRSEETAKVAEIPPELAHCVAEYAERLLEQKRGAVILREESLSEDTGER